MGRLMECGMLCADRTVGGMYENYVTPEQCVPDEPLDIPWESCITLGTSFSFVYEDTYKAPREVICLLVDIVVKGGNLALNVGPQPDGRLPKGVVESLRGIGEWLAIYGDAIYGTRPCAPYKKDGIGFTQKDQVVYAIQTFAAETDTVSETVWIPYEGSVQKITALDTGAELSFESKNGGYLVTAEPWTGDKTPIGRVFCLCLFNS